MIDIDTRDLHDYISLDNRLKLWSKYDNWWMRKAKDEWDKLGSPDDTVVAILPGGWPFTRHTEYDKRLQERKYWQNVYCCGSYRWGEEPDKQHYHNYVHRIYKQSETEKIKAARVRQDVTDDIKDRFSHGNHENLKVIVYIAKGADHETWDDIVTIFRDYHAEEIARAEERRRKRAEEEKRNEQPN